MATASICSKFDILCLGADMDVAKTFTATRAFRITDITALNIAAAADTLVVTNAGTNVCGTTATPPVAGSGVVQAQAIIGPTAPVTIIDANASVAAGAAVAVTTGTADVTKVILHCIGTPQSLTFA